jgi:hypothetical protein
MAKTRQQESPAIQPLEQCGRRSSRRQRIRSRPRRGYRRWNSRLYRAAERRRLAAEGNKGSTITRKRTAHQARFARSQSSRSAPAGSIRKTRAAGIALAIEDAIYQWRLQRFRPIIMTTMAGPLGALPIAFGRGWRRGAPSTGHCSRWRTALAIAHPLHHAGHLILPAWLSTKAHRQDSCGVTGERRARARRSAAGMRPRSFV